MRRRLTFLALVVVAIAASTFTLPVAPAGAHTDACAGLGSMHTPVLAYPFVDPTPRNGSFAFALNTGACAIAFGVQVTGTITGWCGLSSGWGAADTSSLHYVHFVGVGGLLLLSGEGAGAAYFNPDLISGHDCRFGATRWLGGGSVALAHCGEGVSFDLTTMPPSFTGAAYAGCP